MRKRSQGVMFLFSIQASKNLGLMHRASEYICSTCGWRKGGWLHILLSCTHIKPQTLMNRNSTSITCSHTACVMAYVQTPVQSRQQISVLGCAVVLFTNWLGRFLFDFQILRSFDLFLHVLHSLVGNQVHTL